MSDLAQVAKLSPATRAVIAYHGSGRILSLTFLRGREAWTLDDREAEKLRAVLSEQHKVEEAA